MSAGSPIKIGSQSREATRYLGALYGESQGKLLGRAIMFFIENNAEEIAAKKLEFLAQVEQASENLRAEVASS